MAIQIKRVTGPRRLSGLREKAPLRRCWPRGARALGRSGACGCGNGMSLGAVQVGSVYQAFWAERGLGSTEPLLRRRTQRLQTPCTGNPASLPPPPLPPPPSPQVGRRKRRRRRKFGYRPMSLEQVAVAGRSKKQAAVAAGPRGLVVDPVF